MEGAQVDAYLDRIGVSRPERPDLETLRLLHRRHLLAVPFENLSIHLPEDIILEAGALVLKVVARRRGGFCYELNGAFAALLDALGFKVTMLAARVFGSSGPGPLFDHAALRVDLDEPWVADVGFGRHSHYPLRLLFGSDQPDPGGVFRVAETQDGDLDVFMDGAPQYRMETRARTLRDFEPTCWWQCTSPASHFTQSLVCTLLTESGRVTLSDRTLIETVSGRRSEQTLATDRDVLAAYQEKFGISLDQVPAKRNVGQDNPGP